MVKIKGNKLIVQSRKARKMGDGSRFGEIGTAKSFHGVKVLGAKKH